MNKDVEQHLDELIEFYKGTDLSDIEYLKKLFVRNLGDVKRRYVKYDKPRKEIINKAIKFIEEPYCKSHLTIDELSLFLTNQNKSLINILKGEIDK